ncbi:MAG: hypothetical protein MI747_10930 [Desulfobacterales bacterium]|nr:hypothetical protein [Desulfobacterales bacterium]
MAQNWYDPPDMGEWAKRCMSLLNVGICMFTVLVVFSEFRFDWCEQVIGRYLAVTNDRRPEVGAIWETGRENSLAKDSVRQILSRKNDVRQSARDAASFAELTQGLRPGEWVTLEKEQFKRLYNVLPESVARHFIEPVRLVWLINANATDRIFCEGRADGMTVYFIDAGNRVIEQMVLDKASLSAVEENQSIQPGSLETFPQLAQQIYSADDFFKAALSLPDDVRYDLIPDAEMLLAQGGELVRVGIGNESENGFIRLGFEFSNQGESGVQMTRAREWAVWQLGLILKGTPK